MKRAIAFFLWIVLNVLGGIALTLAFDPADKAIQASASAFGATSTLVAVALFAAAFLLITGAKA